MPYRSAKQRAYLHIHEPELAARWDAKYGGKVGGKRRRRANTQATTRRRRRAN
jgi:hypothetical protein